LRVCAQRHLAAIRQHAAELLLKLTPEQLELFRAQLPGDREFARRQRNIACRFARDDLHARTSVPNPKLRALNDAAAEFWARENERFDRQAKDYPDEVKYAAGLAAKLIRGGHIADPNFLTETSLNAATSKIEQLRKQADRSRRARGTATSAEDRGQQNVERDRRIHDARQAGKTPKQIAGDRKIRGKKKLSLSQIYKILAADRP
jgi:hypothetical protein